MNEWEAAQMWILASLMTQGTCLILVWRTVKQEGHELDKTLSWVKQQDTVQKKELKKEGGWKGREGRGGEARSQHFRGRRGGWEIQNYL